MDAQSVDLVNPLGISRKLCTKPQNPIVNLHQKPPGYPSTESHALLAVQQPLGSQKSLDTCDMVGALGVRSPNPGMSVPAPPRCASIEGLMVPLMVYGSLDGAWGAGGV